MSSGLYSEITPTEGPESVLSMGAAGVAGGITGGITMGVILHVGGNLMPFIGALYGWPTVAGGWAAHMINSILIGLLFAIILSLIVRERTSSVMECLVWGIVYAAAVGLVTVGLMIPVSMTVIGANVLPQSLLPVPTVFNTGLVAVSVAVAHVVYGLVLGVTYGGALTKLLRIHN